MNLLAESSDEEDIAIGPCPRTAALEEKDEPNPPSK